MACAVVKGIIADCQSAQEHKVVVNVFISEQEGQGLNFGGQCLWNSDCDKVVSINVSNEQEVCVISAFFSKIPQDSSSDEDEEMPPARKQHAPGVGSASTSVAAPSAATAALAAAQKVRQQ